MKTQINLRAWKKRVFSFIPIIMLALIFSLPCLVPSQASAASRYILATFDGDGASEQELWIYTSTDGLNWALLADTNYQGPGGALRDPSIIKNPADGKYYIAYTNKHWSANETTFSIASSTDLIHWTYVTDVPSGVTGTTKDWAPEFFIDNGVVKCIANISCGVSGDFAPRIYTARNTSLNSWSDPAVMSGLGSNFIDTFIVKSGSTYHAFVQNIATNYVDHATASSLTGPWTYGNIGNWSGWGTNNEGPCVVQLADGSWRFYSDKYTTTGLNYSNSPNLSSWSTITPISSVSSKRHGTVMRETIGAVKISNRGTGMVIDGMGRNTNGANAGQYSSNSSINQLWVMEAAGSYVKIRSLATGLYLDGMGRTSSASTCGQYGDTSSYNQQWTQETAGNYVKFKNRGTGLYLDGMGQSGNGSDLGQYGADSSNNQQWTLISQ